MNNFESDNQKKPSSEQKIVKFERISVGPTVLKNGRGPILVAMIKNDLNDVEL